MSEIRQRNRAIDVGPSNLRPIRQRKRHSPRITSTNPDVDWYLEVIRAAGQSQQVDDPFRLQSGAIGDLGNGLHVIEPPFNFSALLRLPRENNMLRQCIDAMVTNVEGHGWRLEYVGPEEQEESAAAQTELDTLQSLFDFPNDETTLQEMRERLRRDLETLGNAYVEMGRDTQGRVCFMSHVPAHTVRLTNKESEAVEVTVTLPREGTARTQNVRKTFRRYVQIVGTRRVFFKEYGDPREINPSNGFPEEGLPEDQQATELVHMRIYQPGTPYGLPRWINQMPAILGSRQAELTNLDFFKENAVPAMALLVAGGQITQETVDDIEEQFNAKKGRSSFNRITVIEARGDEMASSQEGNIPSPKMELKPLQNERQKDALFQVYDKNNGIKIRSSFRMPPIFVGLADDYSHATAKTSFEVAESQVFGPERARADDAMDLKVLATYGARFWAFRSMPPRITDPDDVITAIEAFDTVGAMTPNVAIGLANDLFDLNIPQIEHEYGNVPFEVTTALVDRGMALSEIDADAAAPVPPPVPPGGQQEGGDQPAVGGEAPEPSARRVERSLARVRTRRRLRARKGAR